MEVAQCADPAGIPPKKKMDKGVSHRDAPVLGLFLYGLSSIFLSTMLVFAKLLGEDPSCLACILAFFELLPVDVTQGASSLYIYLVVQLMYCIISAGQYRHASGCSQRCTLLLSHSVLAMRPCHFSPKHPDFVCMIVSFARQSRSAQAELSDWTDPALVGPVLASL